MDESELMIEEMPDSFELARIRRCLERRGWALTHVQELGIEGLQQELAAKFKTEGYWGSEVKDYPIRREHTRDVVEYRRLGDKLSLNEFPITTIRPRSDLGKLKARTYQRAYMLKYPKLVAFMAAFLAAVPEAERKGHGTLGFDAMRTFGDVVPKAHQDNEEFTAVCVVNREGNGAATRLFKVDDREEMVASVTLLPEYILIFRDRDFVHDATRLLPRFDGDHAKYRDALIATVHYYDSYLGATWNTELTDDRSAR